MDNVHLPSPIAQLLAGSRTQVELGRGSLRMLGTACRELGGTRVLLVTDRGIVTAGHATRAESLIRDSGIDVRLFDGVEENPNTGHVEAGVRLAREASVDLIVGLGGGSSMDCAKGINFLLTNGGHMQDYWGVGKAKKPMLPSVGVPTTAGTGSEAQSFALITDPQTHQKMACGDSKAAFRWAILDPDLTRTCPRAVAAATGMDAISHAVETAATTRRSASSLALSGEAWRLLERSFERTLSNPADDQARADMLVGAHLAGAAIEQSMLGAAHACANPLTARFGITHGVAIGILLPHVVRFNTRDINYYDALDSNASRLADRLENVRLVAGLPASLQELGVPETALEELADEAARQWTAGFNPLTVDCKDLLAIYRSALA